MARHSSRLPGSFEDRCLERSKIKEEQTLALPLGPEHDELMKTSRQMTVAADLEKWLSSPGLMPLT